MLAPETGAIGTQPAFFLVAVSVALHGGVPTSHMSATPMCADHQRRFPTYLRLIPSNSKRQQLYYIASTHICRFAGLLAFLRRSRLNSKRQHLRRTSAYLQGVYSLLAPYGSVRPTRNVNNYTAYFWQGVLPEDDVNVCAISLYLENEPCGVFDMELDAAFPSFERGSLRVRGLTRGSSRELPRDMQGKQILLLAPVVSLRLVFFVLLLKAVGRACCCGGCSLLEIASATCHR